MRGSFRRLLPAAALTAILAGGAFLFLASLPYSENTITSWPTSPVLLDRKGGVFAVFLS